MWEEKAKQMGCITITASNYGSNVTLKREPAKLLKFWIRIAQKNSMQSTIHLKYEYDSRHLKIEVRLLMIIRNWMKSEDEPKF